MKDSNSKKFVTIALLAAVALAGGGWALKSYLAAPQEEPVALAVPENASMQDRMKAMDEFRDKMRREDMTEEERRKLGESMRRFMEGEIQKRVDEYFNADPEAREAILDRHIDEMEEWRKAMEERRQKEEEERAKADEGKSEEEKEAEHEKERERWRDRMRSRSREERKADSETRNPNEMAQRMAYMSAMRKQMEKRGIQPPQWGPGGGGRGFGGPRGGGGRG